jgi:hypothetical protein
MKSFFLTVIIVPFATGLTIAQTKVNPIIKSNGTVIHLPNTAHKPDPKLDYKIVMELVENAEKPDSLNEYLEAVAILINLHGVEGVP